MKKFSTIIASLALAFSASAGILSIPCVEGKVEILQDGQFNPTSSNIGFTSAATTVYLGEVDFGVNGDRFQATSITLANGWYVDGWAILHAGSDYESSLPFTQMAIDETGSYDRYLNFASNMSYNCTVDSLLSGGGPAMEGITYTKPIGRQKVYLTFVGGAGNIRYVNFYDTEFTQEDFVSKEEDEWKGGIALREPNQKPGYDQISLRILSIESVPAVPTGEGTDFPETRIDTSANAHGAWGWTHEGFIADYGTVDFGTYKYKQLVAYFTHWSENIYDWLEVYIDEVKPENQIARFWSGLNLANNGMNPFAKNLKAVNGQHKVLVKWVGGSSNLQALEFVEEQLWIEHPDCGIVLVDELPEPDAFHYTFLGQPEGQGNPWGYEVKCRGQYESRGNIGYTGNGTVIDFYGDGEGVEFGNDPYKRVVIYHSCDRSWVGNIDEANFTFYLDLDPDFIYTPEDWSNNLAGILEGHEPVAVCRLQGTGDWSVYKHVAGEFLVPVTGKHELFMVYNTPDVNIGANVLDIYFDHGSKGGIKGDVNGDGLVDITDANIIINITLGVADASKYPNADVTGDGSVDVSDANALFNLMLGKQ
ncbi:dockerin type I repeat-containing protein [Sodaliphilus sp.]|uniref:dockerin type I repeat-containing protein n=1 Tax=Sodaliphilus sp. TaxID=2815818 RepID=UPI00388EFA11